VWMTAIQFVILASLHFRQIGMVWTTPGLPRLTSRRAKLAFFILPLVVGATWLWLHQYKPFSALVAAAAAATLVLRFPILAGLPVWLLWLFGVQPKSPKGVISFLSYVTAPAVARMMAFIKVLGGMCQKWLTSTPPNTTDSPSSINLSVEEAIAAMNLLPDYTEDELRIRFQVLAQKIIRGEGSRGNDMPKLNASYETLLAARGWAR